jgi:alkylation response protein AidB-like acyl-CoA dehydrogenase
MERPEKRSLLEEHPAFDDISCSLKALRRMPKAVIGETGRAVELARRFNVEVIKPRALELDLQKQQDPDHLPWDFVEEANRWGFYTMFIPRLFGGGGVNFPALSYVIEEMASGCTGMANLVGVHYLGVATLCASWNIRLMNRLLRESVEGHRSGKPCLISLAVTEPDAGTDVEEVELVRKARVSCHAEKVKGGYLVNGRKIFISNGHLSTWHMLIAYEDLKHPETTMVMLAVRNGMPGFSFGRQEHKMGQKACPASELIFEDCFVPDENVCFNARQASSHAAGGVEEVMMQVIDYVVSGSRAGVGGFGTGVARGAFEEALRFAAGTEVDGKLLINHEWAQCLLAEMYKNVAVSRLTYVETNYANSLYGMFKILNWRPLYYFMKYAPSFFLDRVMQPLLGLPAVTLLFRKIYFDWQPSAFTRRTSGWASLCKFAATDAGVRNCQLALEMMGRAGLRHEGRAEKHLRDSKLLQIYEGTNQLNRLNLFKCLIAPSVPQARVFEE